MARFDDLCADFQKRKPRGHITAEVPWFNVPLELQKGSESVNDVLRKYLKDFNCLLYTSPSPRDRQKSRMPSSA